MIYYHNLIFADKQNVFVEEILNKFFRHNKLNKISYSNMSFATDTSFIHSSFNYHEEKFKTIEILNFLFIVNLTQSSEVLTLR